VSTEKLKLRLKNTITDKTLIYASETWVLTKRERGERERVNKHFFKGNCIDEF
jgi:hypothetical protein